jgi:pre-mRNA cleavage complex 2 protein Pcf11
MYQTFMNAYSLVDQQTRRKLDEMLRTWKEPVPGSLDTRPVFSPDITRNIENALIKARTAILENQKVRQPDLRGRNSAPPSRWHPTPPHGVRPNHPAAGNPAGFNTPVMKPCFICR